jgi:hypothetical protein
MEKMEKKQEQVQSKVVYSNLHYNQRKETYKTIEVSELDDALLIGLREGKKGQSVTKVAIALDAKECLELSTVLRIGAERIIKRRFG